MKNFLLLSSGTVVGAILTALISQDSEGPLWLEFPLGMIVGAGMLRVYDWVDARRETRSEDTG